ncbi:hypothetical protein [Amycolatopsis pretoriensis]|uniref:hypothetical protein n=1 Tax=Amycolatopsis pretoriensis TaxID=218821 RepID=UPI000A3BC3F5|nr:hypothetical protein [Amycolatopsis pretoriensis]
MCEADYATSFGERDPGTLTCLTDYARQAGFDGELPDVLRAVDAATRKLGWSDRDQRLETALAYYETTHRGDAATVPAVTYLVPEPASGTTDCGGPSSLSVSSVERSSAPWAKEFVERPVYDPVFERSSGPPAATTAPELLRGHRFVLTFGVGSRCRLPVG